MPGFDRSASEDAAREYLRSQLGDRAPRTLLYEGRFNESPLEGEGPVWLFSFDLAPLSAPGGSPSAGAAVSSRDRASARTVAPPQTCLAAAARHYVAIGQTKPNYFPAYGLAADDAYSLHIGTRFMLEMGVGLTDPAHEPSESRAQLRAAIASAAPGATIENERLAALFSADAARYAVYELTISGRTVHCVAGDCPAGFYSLPDCPPQVALRLHLGKLIRAERDD